MKFHWAVFFSDIAVLLNRMKLRRLSLLCIQISDQLMFRDMHKMAYSIKQNVQKLEELGA